ncbi:Transketolase 1 [Candidatus Annandia adelgestsuga]|uniref:Transketolase n=1 Tax=Candidatus Annandia adelgestsuga TaxID=1302411 RepID=A0A3S9J7P1_9ENTR|nr:transketolase [Candidatus Annandia adelgestsuga]AZP36269.1 Transketolase 1 [Candidatus Annandia adelgestsuga]
MLDSEFSNVIRVLSIDTIQKSKSGHPGAPMGMADIAEVLWCKYMNHNPSNPNWINRDRFILSNGHSSMLIYSILHLTGYDLSIEDIKNFRQLNSKTPGHPEYGRTPGIEATTGPLGQGIANAVGFAISEKTLSAQFNKPNYKIIDHYIYVFAGDGCMMEGISHESCSLAGTLKLNKLIVFYDNNKISIDGNTKGWFTDDTSKRFKSYNWNVIENVNGHNFNEISNAISKAKSVNDKPSLIICNTIIGFGSPNKSGKSESHGAPLGEEEVILTKKKLNWNYPPFFIPNKIYKKWNSIKIGKIKENKWNKKFKKYQEKYPNLSNEFLRRIKGNLPNNWNNYFKKYILKLQNFPKNIASRQASQKTIEFLGDIIPEYIGGSADLSSSNLTMWSKSKPINKYKDGNYIHYGVREFGMTAIANGISLYGGFIVSTASFLTFLDYAKNAVRMSSLMKIRQILIYTHDSIGLGEDGPTHQPIEQLSSLRNIPNMSVWRPCDQVETAVAWKCAIERKNGPTALILSRQNLIQQNRDEKQIYNIYKGGYILKNSHNNSDPDIILISTGSEIELASKVYNELLILNYKVRLVSMPSSNIFDKQSIYYKEKILSKKSKLIVSIEASHTNYWLKYTGLQGLRIGIDCFGESAPAEVLFSHFNFNLKNIIKKIKLKLNIFS